MIRQKNPHRGAVGIGLSDGIAVFVGAHSLQLFEGSGEMGGVRIAHHFSDFADFQFGVGQELLGFLNADGIEDIIEALHGIPVQQL